MNQKKGQMIKRNENLIMQLFQIVIKFSLLSYMKKFWKTKRFIHIANETTGDGLTFRVWLWNDLQLQLTLPICFELDNKNRMIEPKK